MKSVLIMAPHFLNTAKSSSLIWIDTIWPFIHIRKGKRVKKGTPIDAPLSEIINDMADQVVTEEVVFPDEPQFILGRSGSGAISYRADDWLKELREDLMKRQERPTILINKTEEKRDDD